jgi:hypothetical protein
VGQDHTSKSGHGLSVWIVYGGALVLFRRVLDARFVLYGLERKKDVPWRADGWDKCRALYCPVTSALVDFRNISELIGACGHDNRELEGAIAAVRRLRCSRWRGNGPWRGSRRTGCASRWTRERSPQSDLDILVSPKVITYQTSSHVNLGFGV